MNGATLRASPPCGVPSLSRVSAALKIGVGYCLKARLCRGVGGVLPRQGAARTQRVSQLGGNAHFSWMPSPLILTGILVSLLGSTRQLSAVNLAEIVAKLSERGMPAEEAASFIDAIGIEVVEFDMRQAVH